MAAIVWTKVPDSEDVWGKKRVAQWTMTLVATAYAAGGFAVSGATFSLRKLAGMIPINSAPPSATTQIYWALSNLNALQAWVTGAATTAVLAELANGNLTLSQTFLVISSDD